MDSDEVARLSALRTYAILDTPPEPNFDRITFIAAATFKKPICTLSLADAHRHWFKSRFGIEATEAPRRMSFCELTLQGDDVFVVEDARADPRFANAPLVVQPPFLRFYAGAPLFAPPRCRIGTLCLFDTEPGATLSTTERQVLASLAQTVMALIEARARQIELADATRAIAHLARHDALTGLPNRRTLAERTDRIACEASADQQLAILFLDLDGFKAINDTRGHLVGDQLLRQVAARFTQAVRAPEGVARLGGDEFVVLCHGTGDVAAEAAILAARLIDRLRDPFMVDGEALRIGVSIGIAIAPSRKASLDALLRDADAALYDVKATGRGHFRFAPEDTALHDRRALGAAA